MRTSGSHTLSVSLICPVSLLLLHAQGGGKEKKEDGQELRGGFQSDRIAACQLSSRKFNFVLVSVEP